MNKTPAGAPNSSKKASAPSAKQVLLGASNQQGISSKNCFSIITAFQNKLEALDLGECISPVAVAAYSLALATLKKNDVPEKVPTDINEISSLLIIMKKKSNKIALTISKAPSAENIQQENILQLIALLKQLTIYTNVYCINEERNLLPALQIDLPNLFQEKEAIQRIFFIIQYIQGGFQRSEFRIEEITKSMQLKIRQIQRYLSKNLNTSFSKLLITMRIQKALGLLQQEIQISDIINQCGFKDHSYFSSKFRQNVGMRPTDYKKQWNEEELRKLRAAKATREKEDCSASLSAINTNAACALLDEMIEKYRKIDVLGRRVNLIPSVHIPANLKSTLIIKCIKHMEEQCSDPYFNIQKLATLVGKSSSWVGKQLSKIGIHFPSLLKAIRMKKGLEALQDGKKVCDAGIASGINKPGMKGYSSYFSELFAEAYGMKPSAYQEGYMDINAPKTT